jgi:hypothetical protein
MIARVRQSAELSTAPHGWAPFSSSRAATSKWPAAAAGVEGVSVRGDAFLGEVGIGPVFQQQFHGLEVTARGGIPQRRTDPR